MERTEKLAGRARRTERALDALRGRRETVGGLGPPLHHQRDGALGRCRRPTGGCGGRAGRLHARSVHAGHRLGRADRARSAPTGRARPPSSRPLLGRLPLTAGTRRLGPERRGGRAGPGPAHPRRRPQPGRRLHGRHGPPPRPGPLTAGQVRARRRCGPPSRRRPSRRASAPEPSWPPSPRWASISWSSTSPPTISISRPSSSSSRRCRTTAGRSCSSPTTGACSRRSPPPAASSSPAAMTSVQGPAQG